MSRGRLVALVVLTAVAVVLGLLAWLFTRWWLLLVFLWAIAYAQGH